MKLKGFSIIELIIAIGVIIIVSAVIFPGYRNYSESIFLDGEVNSFVRSIEGVRSMAVATKEVPIDKPKDFVAIKAREYGVKINEDGYELFAITIIIVEDDFGDLEDQDVKTVIQRVNFTRDVVFFHEEEIEVRFSPPDPDVSFFKDGTRVYDEKLEILMGYGRLDDPQAKITINRLGLIKTESI